MNFPTGQSVTLCQMIWDATDNPFTIEYDGANEIHNYQPCENLAERDTRKLEMKLEYGFRLKPY